MSFDVVAPCYRSMEAVMAGNVMKRCRRAFLHRIAQCRRALILGEGPGRFLPELLRTHTHLDVVCVDESPRMIQRARRALETGRCDPNRVTFITHDARTWDPPRNTFDLVVTQFFLDCFSAGELDRLIPSISRAATLDATWLLADFRIPERGWRRWRAQVVVALLYAFFRRTTGISASRLTSPANLLEAAGFRLMDQRRISFEMLEAQLWCRGAKIPAFSELSAPPAQPLPVSMPFERLSNRG